MYASWNGKLDGCEEDIGTYQFPIDSVSIDNNSSTHIFETSNGPVTVKNDLFNSKPQTSKNEAIKVEEDEDSDITDNNNNTKKKSKRIFNFGFQSFFSKDGAKNNADQQSKPNSTLLSKFKKLRIVKGKRKTEFDAAATVGSDIIQLDENSVSFHRESPCPFGCKNCGASFDKVETLATHLKLGHCRKRINSAFTNEESVSLSGSISATFASSNSQKRRQRPKSLNAALAKDNAEFQCKLCQKTFSYKWNLQRHMKVHEPDKKFSCEVCGKKFRHKGNVKIHMAKHTKEERYQCTKCGRKFSWHSSLKRHRCIPKDNSNQ